MQRKPIKQLPSAQKHIPVASNSPSVAFKGVGVSGIFSMQKVPCSPMWKQNYIDYIAPGTMIAGHAHPQVIEAFSKMVEWSCA